MTITSGDLGVDETLARRILVTTRRIAPCVLTLTGDAREDAIAILKGVIAELPESGTRRTRSMSRNGTSISYETIETAFTSEARADLRSLCEAAPPEPGLAQASFPSDALFQRLWPEETYP